MIVVKKKMKKPLIIVILAAVLAVLTVAAILLDTFLLIDPPDENTKKDPPVVDTSIGESIHLNSAVAYQKTDEAHISSIFISGDNRYGFKREEKDGPFIFSYQAADGKIYRYDPPIHNEDPSFDYEDVYANEQNDGYGTIKKLTYLTSAFGTLYFSDKMILSDDEAERKKELNAFGFGEKDNPIVVQITYSVHNSEKKDSDHANEEEVTYNVKIGSKLPTQSGYYYMVGKVDKDGNTDYRKCVYTTTNNSIDYAFISFTDYINPLLIAKGLPSDNAFEPYLTTDYQQYKNTVFKYDEKTDYYPQIPLLKDTDGINVIVNAETVIPDTDSNKNGLIKGGLKITDNGTVTFNLGKYSDVEDQQRIIKLFEKQKAGKLTTPLSITVPVYTNMVDVDTPVKYVYTIKSIDAILTDKEDCTDTSRLVTGTDKIKVTYTLVKDGKNVHDQKMTGILDLKDAPDSLKNELKGKSVGVLAGNGVSFERVYNKSNSLERKVDMIIERIISITDKDDVTEKLEKVENGAKVAISYYLVADGVRLDGTYEEYIIVGDEKSSFKEMDEALMGKKVGNDYSIKLNAYTMYSEIIASFTTYKINEIKYFVVKEKIVSFKFQQASERDPYYGESFYVNTTGGDYDLYAINAYACEGVVKILGGLVTNASSSTGLVGTKTVDVVITPEKMDYYNLYDYSIYFELPRGITPKEYKSENTSMDDYLTGLDDYEYQTTLGFNLYISREYPTGIRYIASDLYDVIAEIDAENFKFLEENFVDFYARRNLVMTNISNLGNIKLEFMMDDVKGTYSNKLQHNQLYAYGGKLYEKSQLTSEQLSLAVKYDAIDVIVTPSGDCIDTKLSQYLEEKNYSFVSLRELYGSKNFVEMDSRGTANFKKFIQTLYFTHYEGAIDEEAQKDALTNGRLLMRMSITMAEGSGGESAYDYVYEFYRVSDRRVVVRLFRQNRIDVTEPVKTEVSDFYVSTFSFKKLVNKYFAMMNAQTVDNNVPYPDDSILN